MARRIIAAQGETVITTRTTKIVLVIYDEEKAMEHRFEGSCPVSLAEQLINAAKEDLRVLVPFKTRHYVVSGPPNG